MQKWPPETRSESLKEFWASWTNNIIKQENYNGLPNKNTWTLPAHIIHKHIYLLYLWLILIFSFFPAYKISAF